MDLVSSRNVQQWFNIIFELPNLGSENREFLQAKQTFRLRLQQYRDTILNQQEIAAMFESGQPPSAAHKVHKGPKAFKNLKQALKKLDEIVELDVNVKEDLQNSTEALNRCERRLPTIFAGICSSTDVVGFVPAFQNH
jgi:hypothetical protein